MRRFMEVCLLELLCSGPAHGYALAEQLAFFGFDSNELNISTLYRTLRCMEQSGWVCSSWESGGQGPRRRVYKLKQKGHDALEQWIRVLQKRQERIQRLLAFHGK